ncbi:hypothetical protein NMG60_11008482 [Bertholletia excelsa]
MPCADIISFVDSSPSLAALISYCIKSQNLKLGRLIHSHLIKTGLVLNVFLTNRLITVYTKCNSLVGARKAFEDLPIKNIHSWNTMLSAYSQMGCFDKAHNMLDEIPEPNLVSYNSLISSLTHSGFYRESLRVFRRMQKEYSYLVMDEFTLVGVVGSCACLSALELLRQIHGVAVVIGVTFNVTVCNAMIDAYGKCAAPDVSFLIFNRMVGRSVVSWTSMVVAYTRASRLADACQIFNQMPNKNTVSWTALIAGFAQNGCGGEAVDLFVQMQEENVQPNAFTYVSVLSACADLALLDKGKELHGHLIRSNYVSDTFNVFIFNALIDMYCKCGDMKSAVRLFDRMPEKDVVSWNSLITGFAQNGNGDESLVLFQKMIDIGTKPNHVTFLGVLSGCNHAGLVNKGFQILHSMEKDYAMVPRSEHYAILVDLLGRKNRLEEAVELIERFPDRFNQIGMWGALLGASRMHGNLKLASRAHDALLELESQNAARHVMLSNIYSAAGKWDDARQVRELMEMKGLAKEAAYSRIELRGTLHDFGSKDKLHCKMEEIYELLNKLTDQMKETN